MSMPRTSTPPLPVVLIGLADMLELFPRTAKTTVYRWNTVRSGKRMLPEPLVRVAGSPLWSEEQVLAFAAERGLSVDEPSLQRIRKSQGH